MGGPLWRAVALLAVLAALLPGPARSSEPQEDGAAIPKDLVWPPPPMEPRVRYEGFLTGEDDVKEKKKPSWLDRLAGRVSEQEKQTFVRPYGVAVGKDGRIYVADSFRKAIFIVDRGRKSLVAWRGNAQIPLVLPVGVALDSQSRLFVSDSRAAQVVLFNPEGRPLLTIGNDVLERPAGLAIDERRGRLYVSDTKLNEVLFFDLNTFQLVKRIGGVSVAHDPKPGLFSAPTNLALDRQGRLYVTDTFNCRIQIFDAEGKFLKMFGIQGDRPGNFARPKGIALDSEGNIYVLDAAFGNFQIFDPDGKPLMFVGNMGEAPGQFLLPTGIAIDSQDRIYVAEHGMTSGRLQIFQYLGRRQSPSATQRRSN